MSYLKGPVKLTKSFSLQRSMGDDQSSGLVSFVWSHPIAWRAHPGVLNPTAGYNLPLSCNDPKASPMNLEFLVKNALPVVKSIPHPMISPVVLVGQPRLIPSPRLSKM